MPIELEQASKTTRNKSEVGQKNLPRALVQFLFHLLIWLIMRLIMVVDDEVDNDENPNRNCIRKVRDAFNLR